jgi:sulfate transport system substrate-binding protein
MFLMAVLAGALAAGGCGMGADVELVNVSYDPTRELYQDLNEAFAAHYQRQTGKTIRITQSHGGSGGQARAVIDGLQADVVTLALAADIDTIAQRGKIKADWQGRLPNNSCPYTSTIVFVVRKGNPKRITDWDDLARGDVRVVTPNPKTSGGARWNFLAAWGHVIRQEGKTEVDAVEFVRRLYGNVAKLDTGARGATETFIHRKQGDALLCWENEAIAIERAYASHGLTIVRPRRSIRAEPPVTVVDQDVDARGTRAAAEAYLKFLFDSEEAQDIIGRHGFRPTSKSALEKYASSFPKIEEEFTLQDVAGDWENAQKKFFAQGGVFDQIYRRR